MNKKTKRIMLFGLGILVIICSTVLFQNVAADDYDETRHHYYLYFNYYIEDAFYGDFDGDNNEDDIRIITIVSTNFEGPINSFIRSTIVLPSRLTFIINFHLMLFSSGDDFQIIITTYNTALESGRYLTKLYGIFYFGDYLCYTYDYFIFDPPDDGGVGDPGVEIIVVYA